MNHLFGTAAPKRSDESRLLWFEWYDLLAAFWRPGTVYALNAFVRPTTWTGFAYTRTGPASSVSGGVEPAWPKELAGTVADGSGGWTAVEPSSNGVAVPTSPSVAVSPSGLTLGSAALVNGLSPSSRVQVLCSGGVAGTRYYVTCQVTSGSEILKGTLVVPVDNSV